MERVEAIKQLPRPKDKQGIQRLLGMVNYLGKFIPKLSQMNPALRSQVVKH